MRSSATVTECRGAHGFLQKEERHMFTNTPDPVSDTSRMDLHANSTEVSDS